MIVYIANRGEIASRVIRSVKSCGAKAVAGYCSEDADLPFVWNADRSLEIRSENPRDAYLSAEHVLDAAKKLKATHLHPGYGFLSENAAFVEACSKAGIEFIGPSAYSMRLLGDKIEARKFLANQKISLLPSYEDEDQDEKRLQEEADALGYPLLIKPSAGGGGKGMAVVEKSDSFLEKLRSSKRVAQASFGDERVFLERYIPQARHVEVQVLADKEGHVRVAGERECSLQRRHQKLVEEAPCLFLSQGLREKLFEQSTRIAKAVSYESLGTVEWIWDGQDQIYFLEVNTRLQVEHPVTELVYNIDLVEWQIRIAQGKSIKDLALEPQGHAIEARICAEDPGQNFLPSGGKIHRLQLPEEVRVDFGYEEGNQVSSFFDSMIGKFIASSSERHQSFEKLQKALENFVLLGPKTNRGYLIQIIRNEAVRRGELSTKLLEEMPYQFDWQRALSYLEEMEEAQSLTEDEDADRYSPWGFSHQEMESSKAFWEDFKKRRYFFLPFDDWSEKLESRASAYVDSANQRLDPKISSPMPSKVVSLLVEEGEEVQKGDLLLILEAMKMEHQVKATHAAVVKKLFVSEGVQIPPDEVMMELEYKEDE